MMFGFRLPWLRQLVTALTAVTFVATSQGLSGLELAVHLSGTVDTTHQRQAHFEPAGDFGHGDKCQLGVAVMATKSRIVSAASLRFSPPTRLVTVSRFQLTSKPSRYTPLLPRAPPA